MSKWVVDVVESDEFGWLARLEESRDFKNEEAAVAFQESYNKEGNLPLIEGNFLYARKPREIKEEGDDQVERSTSRQTQG